LIPLFSPLRQNETLLTEIQDRVSRVIRSGEYILGSEVDGFEKALAKKLDATHALGVASGTEALVLTLRALDLKPGDEVITPAFSFIASTSAIVWAGFKPVLADVDLDSMNLSVETVQAAVTPRTRAVIAVDLYGRQAPIAELRRYCDRQGLYLIEDGAQSIGVGVRGAHAYTTSFYPTKNIGAIGDGGAVLTDDGEIANRVREMSRHGGVTRDHYLRVGTTGRLDALQAAVLSVKLPQLGAWTAKRRMIANWYLTHLRKYEDQGKVILPSVPANPDTHVWALFTLRLPQGRSAVVEQLKEKKVGYGIYYPKSLTDQPALAPYVTKPCPNSQRLAGEVLSLPLFPELTGKEFEQVVKAVGDAVERI
jgi:dTDP-4-amino-4,6-dideoxygalactose transaminase